MVHFHIGMIRSPISYFLGSFKVYDSRLTLQLKHLSLRDGGDFVVEEVKYVEFLSDVVIPYTIPMVNNKNTAAATIIWRRQQQLGYVSRRRI